MHSGVIAARDAAAAILSDDIDKYMKDAGDRIRTIKEKCRECRKTCYFWVKEQSTNCHG